MQLQIDVYQVVALIHFYLINLMTLKSKVKAELSTDPNK